MPLRFLLTANLGLRPASKQGTISCFRGQGGAQRDRRQAGREQLQSVTLARRVKCRHEEGVLTKHRKSEERRELTREYDEWRRKGKRRFD